MVDCHVYELFNAEVATELAADAELAFIFYACYPPYDGDTDPLHNPDWIRTVAVELERKALNKARMSRERIRAWLDRPREYHQCHTVTQECVASVLPMANRCQTSVTPDLTV